VVAETEIKMILENLEAQNRAIAEMHALLMSMHFRNTDTAIPGFESGERSTCSGSLRRYGCAIYAGGISAAPP
jgi:hypothetical protein